MTDLNSSSEGGAPINPPASLSFSSADLFRRARAGDEQARVWLFQRCRGYLQMVARSQVETWIAAKVDASDLVQQTMLEAYRDFERFEGDSEKAWLGWLRRILKHNMVDFVRRYKTSQRRGKHREVPFADPADSQAFGAPDPVAADLTPSQEFVRLDDRLRVSEAIEQLSDDYREVIVLRNLQRLSFNEVAERMERSRPAVQMLWMRALAQLQKILEAAGMGNSIMLPEDSGDGE